MVELVYKFNEKSNVSVRKEELTAKVPFKLFGGHIHTYIYIYKWTPALIVLIFSSEI